MRNDSTQKPLRSEPSILVFFSSQLFCYVVFLKSSWQFRYSNRISIFILLATKMYLITRKMEISIKRIKNSPCHSAVSIFWSIFCVLYIEKAWISRSDFKDKCRAEGILREYNLYSGVSENSSFKKCSLCHPGG